MPRLLASVTAIASWSRATCLVKAKRKIRDDNAAHHEATRHAHKRPDTLVSVACPVAMSAIGPVGDCRGGICPARGDRAGHLLLLRRPGRRCAFLRQRHGV